MKVGKSEQAVKTGTFKYGDGRAPLVVTCSLAHHSPLLIFSIDYGLNYMRGYESYLNRHWPHLSTDDCELVLLEDRIDFYEGGRQTEDLLELFGTFFQIRGACVESKSHPAADNCDYGFTIRGLFETPELALAVKDELSTLRAALENWMQTKDDPLIVQGDKKMEEIFFIHTGSSFGPLGMYKSLEQALQIRERKVTWDIQWDDELNDQSVEKLLRRHM